MADSGLHDWLVIPSDALANKPSAASNLLVWLFPPTRPNPANLNLGNLAVWLLCLLLFGGLAACTPGHNGECDPASSGEWVGADTAFVPSDSLQFYFPMEKFRDTSRFVGRDIFVNSWYSKHLYAMREPVLFVDHTPNEFFRFTWLRSFHPPIAIRLERREDRQSLFWKSSDGKGGYEPGELVMDKQKTIDLRTWLVFRLRLEQLGFWKLETNQETFGFDGSRWILEGKVACKYHVVDRWSPNGEDPYFQLCDFLIRLTDLQFAGYEKY